jgi:hypothetical protein
MCKKRKPPLVAEPSSQCLIPLELSGACGSSCGNADGVAGGRCGACGACGNVSVIFLR